MPPSPVCRCWNDSLRRDCLMTPHFLKWSFGPKIEYVDGICHQTDSMNRFYLDIRTGPYSSATTLQGREGQFACRETRSTLRCQSSRHLCPLHSGVLDNRHKMQLYIKHRRTAQNVSKISDQRYEDTGNTECIPVIPVCHVKQ